VYHLSAGRREQAAVVTGGQFLALAVLAALVLFVLLLASETNHRDRMAEQSHRDLMRELRRAEHDNDGTP
jgi:hypothetical protein